MRDLTKRSAVGKRLGMKNLYTIYDVLAEEAGPIFEAVNDKVALRAYGQLLADVPVDSRSTFQLLDIGMRNPDGSISSYTPKVIDLDALADTAMEALHE